MEKLFLNMEDIAVEKELISDEYYADKWKKAQYKTKLGEGIMLVASQEASPEKITFNLNLDGWYRIFIGTINLRSENYTYLKFTGDLCYRGLRHARFGAPCEWGEESYVEEVYFGSRDLTGKQLIMAKPDPCYPNTSGIVWVRCEEMTKEEVDAHLKLENNKNRCIQMHIDDNMNCEDKFECDDDYLIRLYAMKNTNADFCSLEYAFCYDCYDYNNEMPLLHADRRWTEGNYKFNAIKERIFKRFAEYAHEIDIPLYATERMSMADFSMPYTRQGWKMLFNANSQFYCKNRDGSTANVCSYAYPEVQDYVLKQMKDIVKFGFDGVTMIYHRGMHIGFEQPVIDRFKKKYPNVNPCLLPFKDERLHGVWCEIMTEFMQKARKELGDNIKINVIVDYGLETAKNLGLDVKSWAEKGLIDSVSQADMETFEDLSGCMSDENPNLIDMEKYKKKIGDYPVIKRNYANNLAKVSEHINEFLSLEKDYDVKVYHVLPWTNTMPLDEYDEYVETLENLGAKRFLAWNAYNSEWNLPEWYTITHIGNERNNDIVKRRFIRVLELDNFDKSHFNNNWKG